MGRGGDLAWDWDGQAPAAVGNVPSDQTAVLQLQFDRSQVFPPIILHFHSTGEIGVKNQSLFNLSMGIQPPPSLYLLSHTYIEPRDSGQEAMATGVYRRLGQVRPNGAGRPRQDQERN